MVGKHSNNTQRPLRHGKINPLLVANQTESITIFLSTMTLPSMQKAIVQPDKMETSVTMVSDHPMPTPNCAADEHLVRVHTTAITNGELLWTKNFPLPNGNTKILVSCNDVAGTIVVAPPASPLQPATEVYARSSYARSGCAREYTILLGEEMAKRPACLSCGESATVPMSAETAWQALFVHAGIEARKGGANGMRIFITAASGGAGVWMVQLARWDGAKVNGTCSAGNTETLQFLGADDVLDYNKTDFKQWAAGSYNRADLVIDCIGGKALEDA